jgi:hypothetical protein
MSLPPIPLPVALTVLDFIKNHRVKSKIGRDIDNSFEEK